MSNLRDRIVKKIKNYISNNPVLGKITPEREEEIIERIAKIIAKYQMDLPADLFLGIFAPFSYLGSNLLILPAAPFLQIFGLKGYEYVTFFEKRENVERLIERIDELAKKK